MRYWLAALICVLTFTCPVHAGRFSPDLYFDGDRYRAAAIEAQARKDRTTSVRKARVVRARAHVSRRHALAPVARAKPVAIVLVAPLDAPDRSPAMMLLGRFVSEVLSAFGSFDVAARIPNPARDDVFARPPVFDRPRTLADYAGHVRSRVNAACLPPSIKAALASVAAKCGPVTITSAHRPGARVAGSGKPSYHGSCRAADFILRDPKCGLRVLAGWRGGLSTDYYTAPGGAHTHIDTGPRVRFVHRRTQRIQVASR